MILFRFSCKIQQAMPIELAKFDDSVLLVLQNSAVHLFMIIFSCKL